MPTDQTSRKAFISVILFLACIFVAGVILYTNGSRKTYKNTENEPRELSLPNREHIEDDNEVNLDYPYTPESNSSDIWISAIDGRILERYDNLIMN